MIDTKDASLDALFQFLENRCDAIESCQSQVVKSSDGSVKNQMAIKSHHLKIQSTKPSKKKSTRKSSPSSSLEAQSPFQSQESLSTPAQSFQAGSKVINCPLCTGESHQLY